MLMRKFMDKLLIAFDHDTYRKHFVMKSTVDLPVPTITPKMSCGCRPGYFMCPTAVKLWQDVGDAYWRSQNGLIFWREYKQALQDYRDHYNELETITEGK